jgi:sensor histidine kinase YesM
MNKNNTTSHGIGIKNVISRLDLLYQNKYDLNINETNEVDLMINSLFTIHYSLFTIH